jgi:hypothetical protein
MVIKRQPPAGAVKTRKLAASPKLMQNRAPVDERVRMRNVLVVRSAGVLACLPLLVACGVSVVKEQSTASFVDTSQKAVASTQQFYKDLVSANNAYNSFRWAVDPQCPLLSPGERLTAPGFDDPSALPLAIERLSASRRRARSAVPAACAAYLAESCHREAGGALSCRPVLGTVTANGFFCPSQAAPSCASALSSADWKRVSAFTDNPVEPDFNYVSLAGSDFAADTASIRILTQYLDSLAALTKDQNQDVTSELSSDANALQALGKSLPPAATKSGSAAKSAKSKSGVAKTSAATKASTSGEPESKSGLAAPLSSLAGGIQTTVSQGGSAAAIAKVLSQPALESQVSDAIEQLAKAADDQFCTTQPVDALRSASDIHNYLEFGYGPNDLAAREALVNQAVSYEALVQSNLEACQKAQQINASSPQGDYHPASPAGVLLMGVKKANDALVKEIVDGELTEAQRKQARQIRFDEFKTAVEDALNLVTSLKGL